MQINFGILKMKIQIKDIKIKNRFRKDFGDLEPLKKSIKEIGLMHPVVINEDNILIAGERRLKALKELGWKDTPITKINLKNIVRGEYDENAVRKDFTKTEAVAIWQAMESYQGQKGLPSKFDGSPERRQRAAKFLGMSTDTLSKAKQIIDNGNEKLINEMDKTGKVNRVYRKIKIEEKKKEIKKLVPEKVIKGVYDIIVIDPPWKYSINDENDEYDPESNRGIVPYPTMEYETLKKIKIPAAENCILWLWTTNNHIHQALHLVEDWGFEKKGLITWNKQIFGTGRWFRSQTEHIIFAIKGKPYFQNTKWTTLISEKRTTHSTKPEIFYKMVDETCAGRKLDYFARKKREGWDSYGDEVK